MLTSIVIAAYNEGDALWQTVRSCIESCSKLPYEIVVADDASFDNSIPDLQKRFPKVRVVSNETRLGASPTKDLAARSSSGEVLVFLDGHCNPEPGAIARLVEDVQQAKGQAIITPKIVSLDTRRWKNNPSQIGHGYFLDLEHFHCGWLLLSDLKATQIGARQFHESPALIGCAFAIGRELYEDLWGFDPHMRLWGVEDLDFSLKCWLMGRHILHDSKAVIGHRFRSSFDYDVPFEVFISNQLRMAHKNFTYGVWAEWVDACRQRHPGRLPEHPEGAWARIWELFEENKASAEQERAYLHARRVRDEFWYAERFGLAWPKLHGTPPLAATQKSKPESDARPFLGPSPSPPPQPAEPSPTPPCERIDPTCNCVVKCTPEDGDPACGDCSEYDSDEPVRYFNGEIRLNATDIESHGFGADWEHNRIYSNKLSADADVGQGNNWLVFRWAYLVRGSDGSIAVVRGTIGTLWFDRSGSGYVGRYGAKSKLVHDHTNHLFKLTLPDGSRLQFHDFEQTLYPQGLFAKQISPGGQVTEVTSYTSDGLIAAVQRQGAVTGGTLTEAFVYTYSSSGQLSGVLLQRQLGSGAWQNVRQALYAYYGTGSSFGSPGDLQQVRIQVPAGTGWSDTDMTSYRYYTNDTAPGFTQGLKYVMNPEVYARMVNDGVDPLTAADSVVSTYADYYYEYDSQRRVVLEKVDGGTETYTFAFTVGSTSSTDYNVWAIKTVETLPDHSQTIVYTNSIGQYLLKAARPHRGGDQWIDVYQYDTRAHQVLHAHPSAVVSYDDSDPHLGLVLQANAGLIELNDYYSGSGSGAAPGYLASSSVQQGTASTPILLRQFEYSSVTAGGSTVYNLSTSTVYRNDDGSGAINTTFAYTYHAGTTQIKQKTTTWPVVPSGQNGSGSTVTRKDVFDTFDRPTWSMDELGFLTYLANDLGTGALVKRIVDVDTSMSGEFTGLPSGWSTPSGGGLNLITSYEVDSLGRNVKMTYPNGRIDYTVYDDANYEVRSYPAWNASTNTPTGPTVLNRQDRPNGYTETLTMSAAPAVSGGRPTGTEAITGMQSLSRSLSNINGLVIYQDQYFNLTGISYSTAPTLGTSGVNYYRTALTYDDRDRLVRTLTPQGTIMRTVFDFLSRVVSQWTGTNDTPASGDWSPSNNTAPANMVKVTAYQYDNGGVGDSNRTKMTQFPGGGDPNRVTQNWFDWRDRLVASKSGVQAIESTSVHRPIVYVDYDNLDRVVQNRQYDGDGVTIIITGGVPQPPSASLLRAQSQRIFDEQGRVYRSLTFSVDPSSGSVSTAALTSNTYFDLRSNIIATSNSGGLWTKSVFDGAGRTTATYATDGASGTSWSNAGSLTGDHVLEQREMAYDANSNTIASIVRQRFDDQTGTGTLGTPTAGVLARVYYSAAYYDLADRLTDSMSVGTNGGTAWTRPSSVPARSDTVLVNSTSYDPAGRVFDTADPKGIATRRSYDQADRTIATVEDHTDGTPTNDTNKTTNFAYNSAGMANLTAVLVGGHQATGWLYGVSTSTGSDINSDEIAAKTQFPDPSTGNPSSSQQETITVNALGETVTMTDRNGNVHTFSRDVLGRITADAVTTLGSGVDGSVRRIETGYDTQGKAYLSTSFDSARGGSVVNQVQRMFNGLQQLIAEYQEHGGAVNTGTTPVVQYTFTEMAGGANNSRATSLIYPNGRVVSYNYASGLDDSISRLTSMSDTSATLEAYTYLGLGTVVKRAHPQPGVDLTYIKLSSEPNGDGGDKYTGLDRFGRVVDQRWINSSNADVDRYQYTYDRNSNRLSRLNMLNHDFDEVYSYDDLNQLSTFDRGSGAFTQSWDFDAVGNWDTFTTNGTAQTRTHNRLNEITGISGLTSPVYDDNGNMIGDEAGKTFSFDAWNQLLSAKDSGGTPLANYAYDGRRRRISSMESGAMMDLYYSIRWQVLEERVSDITIIQYTWSKVYIDCMIERDRDAASDRSLVERLWVQQDANWNVVSTVDESATVTERYVYHAYGVRSILNARWTLKDSESSVLWKHGFQGLSQDESTGLLGSGRYRAAPYSAILGRWMSSDPIRFESGDVNWYRFVGNDPLNVVDPSGLQELLPHSAPISEGTLKWGIEAKGKGKGNGVQLYMDFVPDKKKCPCKHISFIQVLLEDTLGGNKRYPDGAEDYFKMIETTSGAHVDVLKGDNDPYYSVEWVNEEWVRRWKPMELGSGPDGLSAMMDDSPQDPDARKAKGDLIIRYETFVVCIDTATVMGGLTWGFKISDDPSSMVEITGGTKKDIKLTPSQDWYDAIKAWNSNAYKKGWFTFDI